MSWVVAMVALLRSAAAFVPTTTPAHGGLTVRRAGFGAARKQTPKKTSVRPTRKDLEAQWERFVTFSADKPPEASVWARTAGTDWLLVGSVNRRDGDASLREAFSAQSALIAWCAAEQHLRIQAKQATAEFGLGPKLDKDYAKSYAPATTTPVADVAVVTRLKGHGGLTAADVGFLPYKSPIKEHGDVSMAASFRKANTKQGKRGMPFQRLKLPPTDDDDDDAGAPADDAPAASPSS
mmetsp:Transcript_16226/g.49100  ORF Transcript_16226/g.49100 Transcript_16226/m.49100 type:complete len:237 (+) Transcript_16226:35-745(+)